MDYIGENGQLIGAVTVGYPAEAPLQRPRKKLTEIIDWR